MKILEELWYGNILPHERDAAPKSRLERLGRLIVRRNSIHCFQKKQRRFLRN